MEQPRSGSGVDGVVVTEDLLQDMIRESASLLLKVPRWAVVGSVLALVGAVAFGIWIVLHPDDLSFLGFVVALALWPAAVFVIIGPVTRRHVIAQIRTAYPLGATVSGWIEETGVALRINDQEQRVAWAQVASAEIWPATVFFGLGKRKSSIPRAAFSNEDLADLATRAFTRVVDGPAPA